MQFVKITARVIITNVHIKYRMSVVNDYPLNSIIYYQRIPKVLRTSEHLSRSLIGLKVQGDGRRSSDKSEMMSFLFRDLPLSD